MNKCYKPEFPCNPCPPKDDCCPPDMPNFCPPPAPKPCPMPPVPSVVQGENLFEAVNNLTNRVNICISTFNQVMEEGYRTLHNMEKAATANGSYYGPCEVWTEDGYNADEGAAYTLIHKACVDRRGEPIRVELHLAYNNTTNSKIEQSIFSASMNELADKIVVAQPMGENGWYGNAIWRGCPIQSSEAPTLYTAGFTKGGVLRVYQNNVSTDQMLRDTIENAMGVSGILIQNGQICDDSYYENIPAYDQQDSRICIGQNMNTREVIFLVCGKENEVNKKGLTSKTAANILLQMGCSIAVEVCEGAPSGALDKGQMMFVPADNLVPNAYCYWYISRKCFYKNRYQEELAQLMQNYGTAMWQAYLNKIRIDAIYEEIDALKETDANLQSQITANYETISKEIQDRIEAVNDLQKQINDEITNRVNGDTALQAQVDALKQVDQEIKLDIQDIKGQITNILALIQQINENVTDIQNQLLTINREWADMLEQWQQLTQDFAQLEAKVDGFETRIANLESSVTTLQQNLTTLQGKVSDLSGIIGDWNVSSDGGTMSQVIRNLKTQQEETEAKFADYLPLSGGTMEGNINMGTGIITNVATPVNASDAVPKSYVDDTVSSEGAKYLPLAGGTMTGPIEMNGQKVTGVPAPTENDDAANKAYVDAATGGIEGELAGYLPLIGGTMTGPIEMTNQKITGLATPTNANDAVNKAYVDSNAGVSQTEGDARWVKKAGDTMTGPLVVSMNSKTTELNSATVETNDGTNTVAVGEVEGYNNATIPGVSASGNLNLVSGGSVNLVEPTSNGTVQITNVKDPVNAQDAATKNYVDSAIDDYLPLAGGTMGDQARINVTNQLLIGDSASNQIDIMQGGGINIIAGGEGLTITGNTDFGDSTVTVKTPVNGTDAVNKDYVDSAAGGWTVDQEGVAWNIVKRKTGLKLNESDVYEYGLFLNQDITLQVQGVANRVNTTTKNIGDDHPTESNKPSTSGDAYFTVAVRSEGSTCTLGTFIKYDFTNNIFIYNAWVNVPVQAGPLINTASTAGSIICTWFR